MANKPEEFPTFTPLDKHTIESMLGKIADYLHNISDIIKINHTMIDTSMDIMYEIIERIEKRRIYFHIYYDRCKMGELNEGSLMCFWILKLNPFHGNGIANNILNTKIALCLFMNMLHYHAKKENKKLSITKNMLNDIFYAFRFRDLSKEAIMILAESLIN
ncbi:MAG: hypothetical protein FWG13_00300 [Leptospirales bacterium]|nr:hypothetical protein [Leptospirales bacterium]